MADPIDGAVVPAVRPSRSSAQDAVRTLPAFTRTFAPGQGPRTDSSGATPSASLDDDDDNDRNKNDQDYVAKNAVRTITEAVNKAAVTPKPTASPSELPSEILPRPGQKTFDLSSSALPKPDKPRPRPDEELLRAMSTRLSSAAPQVSSSPSPTLDIDTPGSSTTASAPGSSTAAVSSSAPQTGDGDGSNLMPALPISLGIVGGILLLSVVMGFLYKKGRGPFAGRTRRARRRFEEIDDEGELEKQLQKRWDPRVSRAWRENGAVNF